MQGTTALWWRKWANSVPPEQKEKVGEQRPISRLLSNEIHPLMAAFSVYKVGVMHDIKVLPSFFAKRGGSCRL